ncbi:unnamed protein product [Parnassius apollo]|uniref:(apollo) hypothetical protein n=1 Tax=Parnassius apollo TaxID=110799 RepID=A0A8S3W587_PARAO|nr:unnamed protein product [Parnassius apollo]
MAFAGTNISLFQPDITQKLTERIDDLKQKVAAWGKRIRRFSERSRRFNQNRLFQSDQKRLYKSLERPEVCGAGPGPDQADTVAFWRGLWSEPVNHSEGPWMEVVASQSASVTPMDPVTITPEDVAEADYEFVTLPEENDNLPAIENENMIVDPLFSELNDVDDNGIPKDVTSDDPPFSCTSVEYTDVNTMQTIPSSCFQNPCDTKP